MLPATERGFYWAASAIGYGDLQAITRFSRADMHSAFARAHRHTVLQRVFKQRLEQKLRDKHPPRGGGYRPGNCQAITKSNRHYIEVMLGERELVLQRYLIFPAMLECQSKEIAQPGEHCVGGFNVAVHQSGYAVQRVEQEMRMYLRAQSFELSLGETHAQICGSHFPLPVPAIELERVNDPDHRPECHR